MLSDKVVIDMDVARAFGSYPGMGADERRVIVLADVREQKIVPKIRF